LLSNYYVDLTLPEEKKQEEYYAIVRNVVGERYQSIGIKDLFIHDNLTAGSSEIKCVLNLNAKELIIHGAGVGVVDALCSGLIEYFSSDYISLRSVAYNDFSIKTKRGNGMQQFQPNMPVEIMLTLDNNKGNLYFKKQSKSLNAAAALVVCAAVEFLINSELAVKIIYEDIARAKKRNRGDLVSEYTAYLMDLVHIVSYESVLNKSHGEDDV